MTAGAMYNNSVRPPLLIDDLVAISDDSSDIFTENATKSYYSTTMDLNRRLISGYERSEGEVGGNVSNNTMISQGRSNSRPRGVRNEMLNATYGYDDNKNIADLDNERPIMDSSDGPLPRGGKTGGAAGRGRGDVFVSGESFGGRQAF